MNIHLLDGMGVHTLFLALHFRAGLRSPNFAARILPRDVCTDRARIRCICECSFGLLRHGKRFSRNRTRLLANFERSLSVIFPRRKQLRCALLGLCDAALVAILERGYLNVNLYGDLRTQSTLDRSFDVVLATGLND